MAIRPDTDSKKNPQRPASPKGELEQYGVWVKAEPQDIAEIASSGKAINVDFDVPDVSASLPEESFLSEDEEKLLGTFDAEFETATNPEAGTLPDMEGLPPLNEAPEIGLGKTVGTKLDVAELGSKTIDISLDDLAPQPLEPSINPFAEMDIESIEGLGASRKPGKPIVGGSSGIEDVSSEFLDSFDESGGNSTSESSFVVDDVTAEFIDLEDGPTPSVDTGKKPGEFETLDIDLHFDDTLSSSGEVPSRGGSQPAEGFEEVTDFDDFLTEEAEAEPLAGESRSFEPNPRPIEAAGSFDDLAAVETALSNGDLGRSRRSGKESGKTELSSDILKKIADELASIRGELVSLKDQLGTLQSQSEGGVSSTAESGGEGSTVGGFFDDEEDETIALTGDELDNILNTADFTEETAESSGDDDLESLESLSEASEPGDISLIDEGILPESGDYSIAMEPAIEEVRLGETIASELPMPEPIEFEEINRIAEVGVSPMTEAPDDTSYLEDSILGDGGPLEDGPLVEPDLSEFELETDEYSSIPEIEGELPAVEGLDSPDITLSIDLGSEMPVSAPKGELGELETIPEIDEDEFSEISLHEEPFVEPEIEELDDALPGGTEEPKASKTSGKPRLSTKPVGIHPDKLPSQLDDSLFVGNAERPPLENEEELVLPMSEEETLPNIDASGVDDSIAMLETASLEDTQPNVDDSDRLKTEIRGILSYLDKLLDSLPEEKIEEFAKSQYFDTYKKLFEELGLV